MSLPKPCEVLEGEGNSNEIQVIERDDLSDTVENIILPNSPQDAVENYASPAPSPYAISPPESGRGDSIERDDLSDTAGNVTPNSPQYAVDVFSSPTQSPIYVIPPEPTGDSIAYPEPGASYPACDSAINCQVSVDQEAAAGFKDQAAFSGIKDQGAFAGIKDQGAFAGIKDQAAFAGIDDPDASARIDDPDASAGIDDPDASAGIDDPDASAGIDDQDASAGIKDQDASIEFQANLAATGEEKLDEKEIGAKWDSSIKVSIPLSLLDVKNLKKNVAQELKEDNQGASSDK